MKKTQFSKLKLGAAPLVLSVALVSAPAYAQDAEDGAATGGEIVVTAQKREQRLIDVPSAVTAVRGDALTQRNLTRIEQFAAFTPAISIKIPRRRRHTESPIL